ncbi:MAG: hypothetical protein WDO68_16830 [Gammaproteobacteria bacterium]
MISLSFTSSGVPVFARGAFFRICADSTLRGPEGSLVATYSSLGWRLGPRYFREFEANGPLFLRAQGPHGRPELMGPYEFVRAGDGALFSHGRCLGSYCTNRAASPGVLEWSEITLLDRQG